MIASAVPVVFAVVSNKANTLAVHVYSGTETERDELPTIEQFIQQIKELIKSEQKNTKIFWVKLNTLSESFKTK